MCKVVSMFTRVRKVDKTGIGKSNPQRKDHKMGKLTSAARALARGFSSGGRKMGQVTSDKKAEAARQNLRLANKALRKK